MKMERRKLGLLVVVVAVPLCTPLRAEIDRVALDGFAIDRHEVTISNFAEFRARSGQLTVAEREGGGFEYAGGWVRRAGWNFRTPQGAEGKGNEPAAHVTWAEAREYCLSVGGRLPTSNEWQSAAYTEQRNNPPPEFKRGQTYRYPVGDNPDGMNNSRNRHVAVGTTRSGVNGLFDMGANLWEWLDDRRGGEALTAGGSWWYGPEQTQANSMQWKSIEFAALYIGFRCAYPAQK